MTIPLIETFATPHNCDTSLYTEMHVPSTRLFYAPAMLAHHNLTSVLCRSLRSVLKLRGNGADGTPCSMSKLPLRISTAFRILMVDRSRMIVIIIMITTHRSGSRRSLSSLRGISGRPALTSRRAPSASAPTSTCTCTRCLRSVRWRVHRCHPAHGALGMRRNSPRRRSGTSSATRSSESRRLARGRAFQVR